MCGFRCLFTMQGRHTSKGLTSKSHVTSIKHSKKNEKAKFAAKKQQRDDVTSKELSAKDVSYVTKDQLSRILSSIKSHEPAVGLEGTVH